MRTFKSHRLAKTVWKSLSNAHFSFLPRCFSFILDPSLFNKSFYYFGFSGSCYRLTIRLLWSTMKPKSSLLKFIFVCNSANSSKFQFWESHFTFHILTSLSICDISRGRWKISSHILFLHALCMYICMLSSVLSVFLNWNSGFSNIFRDFCKCNMIADKFSK